MADYQLTLSGSVIDDTLLSANRLMAYVCDPTEADQGDAGNGNSLKDLVDSIGTTKKATIYFLHHPADGNTTTYTLTSSETVPDNISIRVENGAVINGAGTLTLNGGFSAGKYQVFGSAITVAFGQGSVEGLYPEWWGVVADGTTVNTSALQRVFDAAYSNEFPVIFSSGVYLTGKIDYHGQSIFGAPGSVYTTSLAIGQDTTEILGRDSEDVFAFPDPSATTKAYLAGTIIKDLKITVDDTTDYSGSLNRSGVGNAGFSLPNDDGAGVHTYGANMFLEGAFINVTIGSKSTTSGGQNASCGIYQQAQPFGTMFSNVAFARLEYGFWGDQPNSNPTSEEYAPDALNFIDTVFHQCTNPLRIYNSSYSTISGMQIYGAAVGLKGLFLEGFTSAIRASSYQWYISGLFVELSPSTTGETSRIDGFRHVFKGNTLKGDYGEHYITWNAASCLVDGASILGNATSVAVLRLGTAAHSNKFLNIAAKNTTDDFVTDAGYGNLIEVNSYDNVAFTSGRHVSTIVSRPGSAFLRRADFAKRSPSTPYFSDEDLFIWPSDIVWTGASPNLTVTKDATITESGEYVTQPSPGGGYFGIVNRHQMTVGYRVPDGMVRVYVKAKMASSQTTQTWTLRTNGADTKGTAALTIGTSWTVGFFDADISGVTKGHNVEILSGSPTVNQAVDVAWVAIVPWREHSIQNYIEGLERSADPPEPAEGVFVIWMSDGTGKGDDGDIMIGSKAGGTTNYGTLFDHSGGAAW